jgi:hypothetical protein
MILTSFSKPKFGSRFESLQSGAHINYPAEAFDVLLTALPVQILVPLFLDRLLNGE